jgi:hypothetical protein
MQRGRDDEPRKSWHDGAGQCDGCDGNAGRIVFLAIGVLTYSRPCSLNHPPRAQRKRRRNLPSDQPIRPLQYERRSCANDVRTSRSMLCLMGKDVNEAADHNGEQGRQARARLRACLRDAVERLLSRRSAIVCQLHHVAVFGAATEQSAGTKCDIIGERLTMNVTKVINHHVNFIMTANVDGDYDKRGLPDPLVLAFYFIAQSDLIAQLIVLRNRCDIRESA